MDTLEKVVKLVFHLTVNDVNDAPEFDFSDPDRIYEDMFILVFLSAFDPDAIHERCVLVYSEINSPWLSLSSEWSPSRNSVE